MDRNIKKRVLALGASACLLCSSGAFAAEPAQNPNTAASAAVAGAQSQNVAASKTVYVKTDLNVHEQPDASSKVLGTLKKDTAVVVTEEKYGWYTITFNGQTGYISAKYTTETDPSTPTPTPTPETKTVYTTENLKVRAQPNNSAEVLGTLKKGTKVETYGLKDGWYEIKYEGKTGYISAKYTTETDPSTPTPTPETKTVYTTENLKVRAQPNNSAKVLGTLKKGTKVETYGLKDGWYEIKYEGKTGYI
ncbi:MAG: SH3 domain-containing protein, partial [Butyricicoccus sp.]|nr:SH3 domain-containing protein [Butyricicoccus sp.]